MHSFWLLVRADLMVEFLSKALFSGKYPRFIAIVLSIIWIFAWMVYVIIQFLVAACKYCYQTNRYFSRIELAKVQKVARKYGHSSRGIVYTTTGYTLTLLIPPNRRSVEKFIFSTNAKDGRLTISVQNGNSVIELGYDFLNRYTGNQQHALHQSNAQIFYEHICCNWL